MAINNGYITLADLRLYLLDMASYTASTISLTASTKTIADTAGGLRRFRAGATIVISGSANNDGRYTVATGDNSGSFTTNESLTDEAAGQSITIRDVSDDETADSILEDAIEAASRAIDNHTGRRFYAASETRYYTARDPRCLYIDDLLSVTTLKTDDDGDRVYESTWTTSDYDLMPFNATLETPPAPYSWIETTPNGDQSFPVEVAKGVEVAGSFGYASTAPDIIRYACLMLSSRLYKRRDSVFGVAGFADLGEVRLSIPEDGDIVKILAPFKRPRFGRGA